MKLNYKLYSSFGILIVLLIITGLIGLGMFRGVDNIIKEMDETTSPNLLYALEMRTAVFQVQQWLTDASATGWDDGLDEAEEWAGIYRENSKNIRSNLKLLNRDEELRILDDADTSFESYYSFGKAMARAYIDEGQDSGNEFMIRFDSYAEDIGERIEKLKEEQIVHLEENYSKAGRKSRQFIFVVILSILISVTLGAALSIFLSRLISTPIKNLEQISRKVSEGDLSCNINTDLKNSGDEIGSLAKSFEMMLSNLKNLVIKITHNAEETAASAEELSSSTEEVNASSEQVSSTIQQIAQGSQKLSKSASDTREITENLINSIHSVARAAEESATKSAEANDAATEGGAAAKQAGEKMNMISNTVNMSAGVISELGTKSQEINKVIEVINGISEQTNLLALNAAIEAARAGEAGRGFAVVADEVRKLAEESQKATKQIEDMINDIVSSTKNAVDSMQKGTKEVEEGGVVVNTALKSLELISKKVSEVTIQIQEINSQTESQIAASENVKKSITEVSSVAEESAATSEEVSAGVEQTSSAMQQVASAAQSLAANSEELKKMISQFKIEGDESENKKAGKEKNPPQTNSPTADAIANNPPTQ